MRVFFDMLFNLAVVLLSFGALFLFWLIVIGVLIKLWS